MRPRGHQEDGGPCGVRLRCLAIVFRVRRLGGLSWKIHAADPPSRKTPSKSPIRISFPLSQNLEQQTAPVVCVNRGCQEKTVRCVLVEIWLPQSLSATKLCVLSKDELARKLGISIPLSLVDTATSFSRLQTRLPIRPVTRVSRAVCPLTNQQCGLLIHVMQRICLHKMKRYLQVHETWSITCLYN